MLKVYGTVIGLMWRNRGSLVLAENYSEVMIFLRYMGERSGGSA